MTRRTILALTALVVLAALVIAPAASAEEEAEAPVTTEATYEPGTEPAIVVSDGGADEDDPAWTFRYLVPTLIVVSGLALLGLFVWYGLGVKGRYRVAR